MKNRGAFTLLEIILALAVSAIVMFGCCGVFFDLMSTAERLEKSWSFKSHADGTAKFLRGALLNSVIPYPQRIETQTVKNSTNTIFVSQPPESNAADEYSLAFEINSPHPLFLTPFDFAPAKICWLSHDDDGLWLVWRLANTEYKKSAAALYKTRLSPYVKKVAYLYKDDSSGWDEEDKIDSTQTDKMPLYLKLYFEYGDEKAVRIVPLSGSADFQISQ